MNNILSTIRYILCFLIISAYASAQRDRNYIYLLDCTQSMQGYNGAKDIWQPTKQYLRKQIESLSPEMSVHVIPFQNTTYENISFERKNFVWTQMEEALEQYIRKVTGTNICSAWRKGLTFIDEKKDNYFIILTDGEDNIEGTESLCKLISQWCNYEHCYAFYVMLSKEAQKQELKDAVAGCDRIFFIDHDDMIKPFGLFANNTIHIDFEELDKVVTLPFSTMGDFNLQTANQDPHFRLHVQNGGIKNGYATFQLATQTGISDWPEKLKGKESYTFDVLLSSKDCSLLNRSLHVKVYHKEKRLATVETVAPFSIMIDYFRPLGCVQPDSIVKIDYPLNIRFNEGAKKAASEVTWKVNFENSGFPSIPSGALTLLYNGKPCRDLTFVTQANEPQHILTLVIAPKLWVGATGIFEQGEKTITGSLEILRETKLDEIKGESGKLTFSLEFAIKLNIIISVGLYITFFSGLGTIGTWIWQKKRYPRFRANRMRITYSSSDNTPPRVPLNKCNRIVLTNKDKVKKPWFVQTKVITHPMWEREVVLSYDKNKGIQSEGITYYDSSDTTFKKKQKYTITNKKNGESAIIEFH